MSVFPTYSNLTGVERKYVKYWQIFRCQVADTFVYTHSWLNTYSYHYLSLHDKSDHAIPVVGRFSEISAVCVLDSTHGFTGRLAPLHWYRIRAMTTWIGRVGKKEATAFHMHRKLLPGQFDQTTDRSLVVAISSCLETYTIYRRKWLAVTQQWGIISTIVILCEISLHRKILRRSLMFFKP